MWAGDENEPGQRYVLNVVVADGAADRAFSDYLRRAEVTGAYPGLPQLPDGAHVADAFVLTRR